MGKRLVISLIIVFLILISFEAGVLLGAGWTKKGGVSKTVPDDQMVVSATINRLISAGVSANESTNLLSILGAARKPYVSRSELQHTVDGTVEKIFNQPGELRDGYVWGVRLNASGSEEEPYRFFIDSEGMGKTLVVDMTSSTREAKLSDIKVGAKIRVNQLFDLRGSSNTATITLLPDSKQISDENKK